MKRTTKIKWGNLKVGLLITFAVVVMFWASFSGGGTSIFESKGQFICYFKNVNGLVTGSPVWMSGVEVGNVRSIKFVNLDSLRQVRVICRVKKSIWEMITEDSKAKLGTVGFLGDKYVEIIPGTTGKPAINEMDVLATHNVAGPEAMFGAGKKAFEKTGSLVGNIDDLLARVNRGEGTLGQIATDEALYHNLTALMSSLTELAAGLQKNQQRITESIDRTAKSVESLTTQVEENRGTLGKLISDPALYDNLAATSARLDTIMSQVSAAEGSLGLLVNDTTLYVETVNLMSRVNNLISDIQADPRKYFKFSVF